MSAPSPPGGRAPDGSFQRLIEDIYFERDDERGSDKTLLWFCEEVGELVRAIRRGAKDRDNLEEEVGDVYAWLAAPASALFAVSVRITVTPAVASWRRKVRDSLVRKVMAERPAK